MFDIKPKKEKIPLKYLEGRTIGELKKLKEEYEKESRRVKRR